MSPRYDLPPLLLAFPLTPIALIGLPGSGKTTIGRMLARRLGLDFLDSDHVIEQELGCTIRTFFEAEGELAFRDLEAQTLERLARGSPCVLATGGGAVLRPANRACLRTHCRVVYLRATPEDIFQRLRNDQKRPLLQVNDPLARLRALYAERAPLYEETAHLTVDTGRGRVHGVVEGLVANLQLGGDTPAG